LQLFSATQIALQKISATDFIALQKYLLFFLKIAPAFRLLPNTNSTVLSSTTKPTSAWKTQYNCYTMMDHIYTTKLTKNM